MLLLCLTWSVRGVPAPEVRRVGTALEKLHYGPQRVLDDAKSELIFATFLDSIDPTRSFFTEVDIEKLRSEHSSKFDDEIKGGELVGGRGIYGVLVGNVESWNKFVQDNISNVRENELPDRIAVRDRTSKWCKNEDELRSVWKSRMEGEVARELNRTGGDFQKAKGAVTKRHDTYLHNVRNTTDAEIDEMFLSAACRAYDPHTDYMGPKSVEEFDISMELQLCGIGAVLGTENDTVHIVSLVAGGPAARHGGVRAGDKILGIGQDSGPIEDVIGLPVDKVVDKVRGEVGSKIRLELLGDEDGAKPRTVTLVREQVQLNDQAAKGAILGDFTSSTGVLTIPSFYSDGAGRSVSEDTQSILQKFKDRGVGTLVLDLRQNGGGVVGEAVRLAGLFAPQFTAVQIKGPGGGVETMDAPEMDVFWGGPVVVLIDRYSASASEIFAGALQDHGVAVVVGDSKTFGKGTVQAVFNIGKSSLSSLLAVIGGARGGAVKVTIQKFYRPSGLSTQSRGVVSDIVIPSVTDVEGSGEDDLPLRLPFDTTGRVGLRPKTITTDMISSLKESSRQRMDESTVFQTRTKLLEELRRDFQSGVVQIKKDGRDNEKQSEVVENSENATIIQSLRGGGVSVSEGNLAQLYTGNPMPKFSGEDRDHTLEEAIRIAQDLHKIWAKEGSGSTLSSAGGQAWRQVP